MCRQKQPPRKRVVIVASFPDWLLLMPASHAASGVRVNCPRHGEPAPPDAICRNPARAYLRHTAKAAIRACGKTILFMSHLLASSDAAGATMDQSRRSALVAVLVWLLWPGIGFLSDFVVVQRNC